jgi:hypothetical protein
MEWNKPLNVDLNEITNPLSYMANYTYNFKLFVANEYDLSQNNFDLSKVDQIILAETGKTSLYINSVKINSAIGPSSDTLSGFAEVFEIEILEPKSVRFLDQIYFASQRLGLPNIYRIPFYLSLTFIGYTEDGDPVGLENDWTYRIELQTVSVDVDAGGAKYLLKAWASSSTAMTKEYGALSSDIVVRGVTIVDMITDLERAWNKAELEKKATSVTPLVQYKFLLHEDPSTGSDKLRWEDLKMLAAPGDTDKRPSRATGFTKDDADKPLGHFNKGDSIQSIMDSLISSSSWARDMLNKIPTANDKINTTDIQNQVKTAFAKCYRIESEIIHTSHDANANSSNKLIIYHIWPYNAVTPVLTAAGISTNETDAQNAARVQEDRGRAEAAVQNMSDGGMVRKAYYYIFTGKNTEVLDFKIHLNNVWDAAVPTYAGNLGSEAETANTSSRRIDATNNAIVNAPAGQLATKPDTGSVQGNWAITKQYADKLVGQLKQEGINAKVVSTTRTAAQQAAIRGRTAIAARGTSQHELGRAFDIAIYDSSGNYIRNWDHPYWNRAGAIGQSLGLRWGRYFKSTGRDDPHFDFGLGNNYSAGAPGPQPPRAPTTPTPSTTPRIAPPPLPRAVKEDTSVTNKAPNTGVQTQDVQARSFFTSLLNQLYTAKAADWISLDIVVRGDPYWLGGSKFTRLKSLNTVLQNKTGALVSNNGNTQVVSSNENTLVSKDEWTDDMKARAANQGSLQQGAGFETQAALVAIIFRTPLLSDEIDENEAFINELAKEQSVQNNFISGIYQILTVESRFEGGKFTQTLKGMQDANTANHPISLTSTAGNSTAGNRGQRNNNPGNIKGRVPGSIGVDADGFAIFPSTETGADAITKQLKLYYTGQSRHTPNGPVQTISGMISIYAPPNENNTALYIKNASQITGIDPNAKLTPDQLPALARAIAKLDSGTTIK